MSFPPLKKKQHRPREDDDEEEPMMFSDKIDASKLPEYQKFLNQIEQLKEERLHKIQQLKDLELQSLEGWANAERKQAWDDFHTTQNKIRSDLIRKIQAKITTLKQERKQLNKQLKENEGYAEEPDSNDLMYAKQRSITPNLVYSDDYESKSDTAEASPHEHYERGRLWPSSSTNNTHTTIA